MNEIPNRLGQVRRSEFQVNPRGEFCARSKVAATAAAVTLAIALGLVDYLTGREWAISALYLLPTCFAGRSEEHTSELQSQSNLVCRLLLEKKKKIKKLLLSFYEMI